ncbi:DUF2934 domain-containing protein [Ancylobacter sp.]|uniref:DUF2934 domain-containing protein n=1 Tax=Ancylobacter sp. TaxID=1872567 RepID=UPI003D115348
MSMSEEDIRARAHRLWEADGRPDGHSDHYWFRARQMLVEEGAAQGAGDGSGTFRSVNAAEVPPEQATSVASLPGGAVASANGGIENAEDPTGHPTTAADPALDPHVRVDALPGGNEPVSEIDTIRRTLEVPKGRRGRGSPANDQAGAMSGLTGSRQRS